MVDTRKKIVLIGNYLPDKQESMKLFMFMFYDAYVKKNLLVEVWYPTLFFGKMTKSTNYGIGKWLAYLDKYILFPIVLTGRHIQNQLRKKNVIYHICDHSNAPYLFFLPKNKTVISCHDVLAIRGALGFKDAYCEASSIGKILQKWILFSLFKAQKIGFVSEFTRDQFLELKLLKKKQNYSDTAFYKVIYNGFNENFIQLTDNEIKVVFEQYDIHFDKPYILHVGSDLPRKNRSLLVEMLNELNGSWDGVICFVGQKIDSKLNSLINKYGLQNRVISIVKPPQELLLALYNGAEAFVFPSFAEGFGWPLIEAQACGTPVITSALDPMIEVCNGAALHVNPFDPNAFVNAFKSLADKSLREDIVQRGLENCKRFEKEDKIIAYLNFYEQ